MITKKIKLPIDDSFLDGDLTIPDKASTLIIFLSGYSNDLNSFNHFLASHLQDEGYATLLFDFLRKTEKELPKKLDAELLTRRIITITTWINNHSRYHQFDLGFLGITSGAVLALKAAAELGPKIKALVSIEGEAILAENDISNISSPTLLIVAEYDFHAIKLNSDILKRIKAIKNMVIVPGASHFFEEPHKMEQVAAITTSWFRKYLKASPLKQSQTTTYRRYLS